MARADVEVRHEESATGDLYGATWVLFRKGEDWHVEAWHGPETGEDAPVHPWTPFQVYRVNLPADVYAEHTWVTPDEIEGSDAAKGRGEDPLARAWELVLIAEHHGWEEFDSYPLRLTATELYRRWGNTPSEDPRRDCLDEVADAPLLRATSRQGRSLDHAGLSDDERAALEHEGVRRLYAAVLSSQLGGWDFWDALRRAIEHHGKTYDVGAGHGVVPWTIDETINHIKTMKGLRVPNETCVAFVADIKEGVARAARPVDRDHWEEKKP